MCIEVESRELLADVTLFETGHRVQGNGTEAPACINILVGITGIGLETTWAVEAWEHATACGELVVPTTDRVVVEVVDLKDRFFIPLTALVPDILEVGGELVTVAVDQLLHITECLVITAVVILDHHHLGIDHIGQRLGDVTLLLCRIVVLQGASTDNVLKFSNYLGIYLVGSQLI